MAALAVEVEGAMTKLKQKREPRPPMLTNELPATFAEAEEREIHRRPRTMVPPYCRQAEFRSRS